MSRCGPHRTSKLGWRTPRPKASTFRTYGWARTCHIKTAYPNDLNSRLLNAKLRAQHLKACTYNIDMAGIFV